MKLIFAEEDSVYGIIMGLILLGVVGTYYKVPNLPQVWGGMFGLSLVFSILDFFHSFSRMHRHIFLVVLHWVTVFVDIILELALIAFFFNLNTIPYVSTMVVPLLKNMTYMFYIGAYFVVSNVFWVVMYPIAE